MNESNNWPAPDPIQAGVTQSSWTAVDMGQEQLASFGQRVVGYMLDSVNAALWVFLIVFLFFRRTIVENEFNSDSVTPVFLVVGTLLQIFWGSKGGSPFRLKYGAVIVDMHTGLPIGIPRAFLRVLVANISWMAFGLGFLWMLWDPKKQTWHDKAARTLVVKR